MNKEQVFEKFHEYEMKIGTRDVLITVRKEVGTEFYECKFNKGQKKDFINGYKGFGFNVSIVNDEVEFITKSTTLKNELNSKNWHNKKEIQFRIEGKRTSTLNQVIIEYEKEKEQKLLFKLL